MGNYATCTKYGYMDIAFKDMREKGSFIISLESMLSHMNVFNAHTIEYIPVKDFINIKHDNNQRHIIIKSCYYLIFNRSYKHNKQNTYQGSHP